MSQASTVSQPSHAQVNAGALLALICVAQFMVFVDDAIVNVALPSIQGDLGFGENRLAWTVNAYLLMFGGFVLLGGRASDLFGRRRVFTFGVALFTAASLACGLAQSDTALIVLRGLQGLGAALLSPSALAILMASFSGEQRTRALATWGALVGFASGVGVLLSGVLTEVLDWRWVFLINVPVGLAVLALIPRLLPADVAPDRRRPLDAVGAILGTGGLLALIYTVMETTDHGWTSGRTLGGLALAVVLLIAFLAWESRTDDPLLPLGLLTRRSLAVAAGLLLVGAGAIFVFFYFVTLYMQLARGWEPLTAGLAWLPFSVAFLVVGGAVLKALPGKPVRPFVAAGAVVSAIGFVLLALLDPESGTLLLLLALVIVATGMSLMFAPTTSGASVDVEEHEAGIASGVITSAQQLGGGIALAAAATLAAERTRDDLAGGAANIDALVTGYSAAFVACAVACGVLVGGAMLFRRIRAPQDVAATAF